MNRIVLIGNSQKDVELETSKNGIKFAKFGLAVKRRSGDKVDWFECVCYNKLAENVASVYVKKGTKVVVSGSMESNEFTKADGSKSKSWFVNVADLEVLSSKKDESEKTEWEPVDDGDLPF